MPPTRRQRRRPNSMQRWHNILRVTTLTFQGHLTSSVMWPFDTPGAISYKWPIATVSVPPAVFQIFGTKHIWVITIAFSGYVTSSDTWPLDSPYTISYNRDRIFICVNSLIILRWTANQKHDFCNVSLTANNYEQRWLDLNSQKLSRILGATCPLPVPRLLRLCFIL